MGEDLKKDEDLKEIKEVDKGVDTELICSPEFAEGCIEVEVETLEEDEDE